MHKSWEMARPTLVALFAPVADRLLAPALLPASEGASNRWCAGLCDQAKLVRSPLTTALSRRESLPRAMSPMKRDMARALTNHISLQEREPITFRRPRRTGPCGERRIGI